MKIETTKGERVLGSVALALVAAAGTFAAADSGWGLLGAFGTLAWVLIARLFALGEDV